MKIRSMTLALFLAASVLVACNESSYAPLGGVPEAQIQVVAPHAPAGISLPDAVKICSGIPFSRVPGHHVEMFAVGNLKHGKFSGTGFWFLLAYKIGKPGATPTPGVTPTPIKGKPLYLYYGKYSLKTNHESGCAFLVTTQNGKPLSGKYNAASIETVVVKVKYLKVSSTTTEGPLLMKLTGITPTSGRGSATLTTTTGGAYDSATITLLGRAAIP
jgi:hypothetical protein